MALTGKLIWVECNPVRSVCYPTPTFKKTLRSINMWAWLAEALWHVNFTWNGHFYENGRADFHKTTENWLFYLIYIHCSIKIKGVLDNFNLIPISHTPQKCDFCIITSVYLCSACMLNLTCSFNYRDTFFFLSVAIFKGIHLYVCEAASGECLSQL